MITKIGINIITKTAREQDLLIGWRERRAYYEDPYEGILEIESTKIISKYTNCNYNIESDTSYLKDGRVLNVIIFELHNTKGIDKKALRAELEEYIYGEWEKSKGI